MTNRTSLWMAMLIVGGHAATAQAANWVSIGKTDEGGPRELFIDTSTIRIAKSIQRAWIKTVFQPNSSHVDHMVEHVVYDCNQNTMGLLAGGALYFDDGSKDDDSTPWGDPKAQAAASAAARLMTRPSGPADVAKLNLICTWKPT